jgi:Leucine-rich repeat (LRR) protein
MNSLVCNEFCEYVRNQIGSSNSPLPQMDFSCLLDENNNKSALALQMTKEVEDKQLNMTSFVMLSELHEQYKQSKQSNQLSSNSITLRELSKLTMMQVLHQNMAFDKVELLREGGKEPALDRETFAAFSPLAHWWRLFVALKCQVPLEQCPSLPNEFKYLNQTKTLILAAKENNMDVLPNLTIRSRMFEKLPFLRCLDLSFCQIEDLECEAFNGLSRLESLNLQGNPLKSLVGTALWGLESVIRLDLSKCELQAISPTLFCNMNKLNHLNLQNNQLAHLNPLLFSHQAELVELTLFSNCLEEIDPELFANLSKLERLFLRGNKLTCLHPDTFKELKSLKFLTLGLKNVFNKMPSLFRGLNLKHLDDIPINKYFKY